MFDMRNFILTSYFSLLNTRPTSKYLTSFISFILFVFLLSTSSLAFSFAVLGDSHDGWDTYETILKKINADKDIKFAINTGDFASNGKLKNYQKYIKISEKCRVPIYNVPGNHDESHGGYKYFSKFFGPFYYSFDYENAHFILLNNAFKSDFDNKQYEWLISDLKQNKKEKTFVFMHKPVFDSTEILPDYIMDNRRMTGLLIDTFKKYRVNYVMSGHLHTYARAGRDGIVYIISGGAGGSLHLPYYMGGFNHYMKITVDSGKIADEVIKLDD